MKISIELDPAWVDRARLAMGGQGSNDDEHELLCEIVDLVVAATPDLTIANRLATLLNEGKGQCEALALVGVDEDDAASENACLPFDDPHNAIVDLCNGTYVQRHGGRAVRNEHGFFTHHEGGTWQVHTYTNGG